MCILEPAVPITVMPNALADHSNNHFESLLVCATIVSMMGSIQAASPPQASSSTNGCSQAASRVARQVCPLSNFILGGPMPPTPGLIPLCWDDLIDWTIEATLIREKVYQSREEVLGLLPSAVTESDAVARRIRFVPYVSLHETDAALQKLPSQSYMERAQFYQESVVIAVKPKDGEDTLCLITLFQFCRYFTLIRRLDDSLQLVSEYRPAVDDPLVTMRQPASLVLEEGEISARKLDAEQDSLLAPPKEQQTEGHLPYCVICLEKTEDSVLFCCSQAICSDCERRWVRRRLRCPFCRQSFASVKEAVQTQWQLSSAIPVEQVLQDVQCLGKKVHAFWKGLIIGQRNKTELLHLATLLSDNYVQHPKTLESSGTEEGDGFVMVNTFG